MRAGGRQFHHEGIGSILGGIPAAGDPARGPGIARDQDVLTTVRGDATAIVPVVPSQVGGPGMSAGGCQFHHKGIGSIMGGVPAAGDPARRHGVARDEDVAVAVHRDAFAAVPVAASDVGGPGDGGVDDDGQRGVVCTRDCETAGMAVKDFVVPRNRHAASLHKLVDVGRTVAERVPALANLDLEAAISVERDPPDAVVADADGAGIRAGRDMEVVLEIRAAAAQFKVDPWIQALVPHGFKSGHVLTAAFRAAHEVVVGLRNLRTPLRNGSRRAIEHDAELDHGAREDGDGPVSLRSFDTSLVLAEQLEPRPAVRQPHIHPVAVESIADFGVGPLPGVLDERRIAGVEDGVDSVPSTRQHRGPRGAVRGARSVVLVYMPDIGRCIRDYDGQGHNQQCPVLYHGLNLLA